MKKNAPGGQGKALSDGGVLCLLCKKIYNLSVVLEIKTRYNKKPIKTEKDFSTWLRCIYYTTKAVIIEYIYF